MTDIYTEKNSVICRAVVDWETTHGLKIEDCRYSDLKVIQDDCMSQTKGNVSLSSILNVIAVYLEEKKNC